MDFGSVKRTRSYRERREENARRTRRIVGVIVTFILFILFYSLIATPLYIDTKVMSPTLEQGDRVIYSPLYKKDESVYQFFGNDDLNRGDLVVVHPPYYRDNQDIITLFNFFVRFTTFQKMELSSFERYTWESSLLVKRLVALPGDSVMFKDHMLYIKKKGEFNFRSEASVIPRGYEINSSFQGDSFLFDGNQNVVELKDDEFFVLNDQRGDGNDSSIWGVLHSSDIQGRIFMRYWPFRSFKLL